VALRVEWYSRLCVVEVDPEKLIEKLRLKIPAEFNFHVEMTQIAPRLRSLISSYKKFTTLIVFVPPHRFQK
jgi:hypothetical protein